LADLISFDVFVLKIGDVLPLALQIYAFIGQQQGFG
jgi:hypothetical protein